ncbi:cyclophilin-like fold protein [Cellulomonas sp. NS3]|uniref:cyclophilin-like fold protein n=1 Tax=Cellulomonas sp. NS3 TaxID=2973977 RepID=UPI002161B934|nr:cyclophilin-like fold protein [Cellulomonas sp. NS3]
MSATARHGGLAVALVLSLTACTATPEPTGPAMTRPPAEPAPTATPAPDGTPGPAEPTAPTRETALLLTIGDTTVPGRLWDNPAAHDLAARLPLTLTFGDHGAVEKTARLDPALTMDGMPAGDDPGPGEIGWYAPSTDLVLYYGDVGYWDGIARLGTVDPRGVALLAEGPEVVTVTIARADD